MNGDDDEVGQAVASRELHRVWVSVPGVEAVARGVDDGDAEGIADARLKMPGEKAEPCDRFLFITSPEIVNSSGAGRGRVSRL